MPEISASQARQSRSPLSDSSGNRCTKRSRGQQAAVYPCRHPSVALVVLPLMWVVTHAMIGG